MNWLERLDVIVLVVMLVYVAVSVARGFCCFRIATKANTASSAFQRSQRTLLADLNLRANTLNSIGFAAPYLGLGGACLGILSIFRGYDGSSYGYVVMVATGIAAALISTATGLLVAIAAIPSYNYLRTQTDFLEREISNSVECRNRQFQFAERFPLTPRFSIFSFALIAVPTLAVAITVFMAFLSFHTPTGLHVRLLKVSALESENDFLAEPIIVGMVEASTHGQIGVYVNGKKTPLEELRGAVHNELKSRPQAVAYVAAEKTVRWADLTSVIDTIESLPAEVVLVTASPPKTINMSRPRKTDEAVKFHTIGAARVRRHCSVGDKSPHSTHVPLAISIEIAKIVDGGSYWWRDESSQSLCFLFNWRHGRFRVRPSEVAFDSRRNYCHRLRLTVDGFAFSWLQRIVDGERPLVLPPLVARRRDDGWRKIAITLTDQPSKREIPGNVN